MSEKLHFIIAADHHKTRSLVFSKKSLLLTSVIIVLFITVLATGSLYSTNFFLENKTLAGKISTLEEDLAQTNATSQGYSRELADLQKTSTAQISQLKYKLKFQLTQFQAEKRQLVNTAVSELKERSQFIENVMDDIGVKIKKDSQKFREENSGGPYLTTPKSDRQSLIQQTDKYLKVMAKLPLGRPVPGPVTSWYGSRKDPMNKKHGFHSGIDFRGKHGTEVMATADGKVIKAGRNGSYGLFVQIDHGNGYSTCFAHMKKFTVKKGERVSRGQTIGLIGSSGRSTGPHLHYELRHNNKTINPKKFLKVADLSFLSTNS